MKNINILFVDDEEFTLNSLERLLHKEIYTRLYVKSGESALAIMEKTPVQILVTDMKMPGMDGLTLLREVKEKYPDIVRIALSAYIMTAQLLPCINTGEIYRFITKPIVPEELRRSLLDAIDYFRIYHERTTLMDELRAKKETLQEALEQQQHTADQLKKLGITDSLTGMYDKRYVDIAIENEFRESKGNQQELSCLMMDIDNFKQFKGRLGDKFSDLLLKWFASHLGKLLGSADMAFRYDKEKLLVIMPLTSLEQALIIANRILSLCRKNPFKSTSKSIAITVSIGAASLNYHQPESPAGLIMMADKMLYEAKKSGKNQVAS